MEERVIQLDEEELRLKILKGDIDAIEKTLGLISLHCARAMEVVYKARKCVDNMIG